MPRYSAGKRILTRTETETVFGDVVGLGESILAVVCSSRSFKGYFWLNLGCFSEIKLLRRFAPGLFLV